MQKACLHFFSLLFHHSKLRHSAKKKWGKFCRKSSIKRFQPQLPAISLHIYFSIFHIQKPWLAKKIEMKNRFSPSSFFFTQLSLLLICLCLTLRERNLLLLRVKKTFFTRCSRFRLSITTATDELISWLIYCRK
jgi:hypothetical protein